MSKAEIGRSGPTNTEPCPVCGKWRIIGYEHEACRDKAATAHLPEVRIEGDTMIIKAGSDLDAVLAILEGKRQPMIIRREQFDYESEDGTTTTTFDVTRMLEDIEAGKLRAGKHTAEISLDWVQQLIRRREPDLDKVLAMPMEIADRPLLLIEYKDHAGKVSHLLIDGTHRYLALWKHRVPDFKFHMVAWGDWQPYAHERKNEEKK